MVDVNKKIPDKFKINLNPNLYLVQGPFEVPILLQLSGIFALHTPNFFRGLLNWA